MKKKIRKYGATDIISFTKSEMDIYKLKTGDVLDLSDAVKVKRKRK